MAGHRRMDEMRSPGAEQTPRRTGGYDETFVKRRTSRSPFCYVLKRKKERAPRRVLGLILSNLVQASFTISCVTRSHSTTTCCTTRKVGLSTERDQNPIVKLIVGAPLRTSSKFTGIS